MATHVQVVAQTQPVKYNVRGWMSSASGYPVSVRARVVQRSPLAAALAPPQRERGGMFAAVAGASVIFGGLNLVFAMVSLDGGRIAVAAAIMVAVGLWISRRRRQRQVHEVSLERAMSLWRNCWYCRRCGIVSLLTASGSVRLPVADLSEQLEDLAAKLQWSQANQRQR